MPLPRDDYTIRESWKYIRDDVHQESLDQLNEARYWARKMKRERDELQKEVGRLAIYEPLSETWMERTFYQQKKVKILAEALADIAEHDTTPLAVLQIIDRAIAKVG